MSLPFTTNIEEARRTWRVAEDFLHHLSGQCKEAQELVQARLLLEHVTTFFIKACQCPLTQAMAIQLCASPQRETFLITVLGQMLQVLISVPFSSLAWQNRNHIECIERLTSLLESILDMHVPGNDAAPTALGLQLAKQLQQADFMGTLATYMHHVSDTVRQGLTRSSTQACHYSARSIRLQENYYLDEAIEQGDVPVFAHYCDVHSDLLSNLQCLATSICKIWPGGVYKSAAARGLMSAAADLAEASLHFIDKLLRAVPADAEGYTEKFSTFTHQELNQAVQTACKLVDLHHKQTEAEDCCAEDYILSKCDQYQKLLTLLTIALAAVCRSPASEQAAQQHQEHQQVTGCCRVWQGELQQQLWHNLGYEDNFLDLAVDKLESILAESAGIRYFDTVSNYSVLGAVQFFTQLIQQLEECWCARADKLQCLNRDGVCDAALVQRVNQDLQLNVLVMKVAEMLYINGQTGVRGDLQLLAAIRHRAVSDWVSLYLAIKRWEQEHGQDSTASLSFPVVELFNMLLAFIEHTLKAAAAAATTAAQGAGSAPLVKETGTSSSSTSPTMLIKRLLQTLDIVLRLCVTHNTGEAVVAAWSQLRSHTAALLEAALRWSGRQTGSVADDPVIGMRSVVMEATSRLLDSGGWPGNLLQLALNHVQPTTAATTDSSSSTAVEQQPTGSSAASRASTGDTDFAAVEDSGPDSPVRPVRPLQAEPTAMQLRVLSMMNSCCKLLMYHAERYIIGEGALVLDLMAGLRLISSASNAVSEHVQWQKQQQQQHLTVPIPNALRCWLTLLARSFITIGRQLEMQMKWFEFIEGQQQQLSLLQDHLLVIQRSMQNIEDQKIALYDNERLQELTAMAQRCEKKLQAVTGDKAQRRKAAVFEAEMERIKQQVAEVRTSTRQSQAFKELCDSETVLKQQQRMIHTRVMELEQVLQRVHSVHALDPLVRQLNSTIRTTAAVLVDVINSGGLSAQQQVQASICSSTAGHAACHDISRNLHITIKCSLMPTALVVEDFCNVVDVARSRDVPADLVAEDPHKAAAARAKHLLETPPESFSISDSSSVSVKIGHPRDAAATALLQALAAGAECPDYQADVRKQPVRLLVTSTCMQRLHDQLVSIGSELITALPHCWCCNNPRCVNLSADSELQLISGKQRICGGCTGGSTDKDINSTAARYCSVECQKQHWKQHKRVCRRLHKQCKQLQ